MKTLGKKMAEFLDNPVNGYITWTLKKNPSFYLPASYSQLRAQSFGSFLRSYRKQMVTPSFEFVNELTQN